ncbi:phytoene desaturase [bacterium]|nr:phytoene desaturase [bacterium]
MADQVIVIGGGVGGLAGAIRLATTGHRVTLFEQNSQPGGKMNLFEAGGYRFDTGPSLLTMPFVFDQLFEAAGDNRPDHLEFVPVDPVCRYFYPDGVCIDSSADVDAMQEAIATLSPADGKAWKHFLEYTRRIYDATADVFLFSAFQEWRHLLKQRNLGAFFKLHRIDAMRTVHSAVSSHFSDPRVVQLFDRYATYNGSDPYRAPATLNVIPYVEHGLGGFYIKGGMYRLVEEMVALAVRVGVDLRMQAPVEKILHNGKRVEAVVVDGARHDADAVLCNADVVTAHQHLIDGLDNRVRKLKRLEPSLSGMVFMWGVRGIHRELAHHNIFFSKNYEREFQMLFDKRSAPNDPTIYVAITQRADPSHAPASCENWFVLLNMPYLADGQDWQRTVGEMRQHVLERLRNTGIDLHGKIELEEVITPEDFHRLYGSNAGSIYGLSSNTRMAAFRRPPNRSRDLHGLYFAGGSSHPGGGVPLATLSGMLAADLLYEHEANR